MSLFDSSAKRLCLWALMWNGLPVQAETELLVLGTPSVPPSILTSTLTLTTTVLYKPSLDPGNSQYTLVGCYSPLSSDGGHIFGPDDYDGLPDDKVTPSNLTIDRCLQGCGSITPPNSGIEDYIYAGLRNGSECRCSNQLPPDAHKLSPDDCTTPCSGDVRLSCGGHDNVVVYSLISANSKSSSSTLTNGETTNPSSTTGTKGKETAPQTAVASHETHTPSAGSGKPVSTPTIAAVTGSLSGAIILAAGLFLCYRARTRKKRIQDRHVKLMLERRGRFPAAEIHNQTAKFGAATDSERDNDVGSGETNKHDNDALIPNTPALEAGGRFPPGLHPRTSASAAGTTRRGSERNDNSVPSTGEVRSRPTSPHTTIHAQTAAAAAGASSAVQWHNNAIANASGPGGTSAPQTTMHKRTMSINNIPPLPLPPPPPSARIDSLGDRAWHRRKLSTPYQPPLPPGSPGSQGVERGNIIARRGPPSGPPNNSLPLTPPGLRARSQPRVRAAAGDNMGELSGRPPPPPPPPPPRPRRSFEMLEPEHGDYGEVEVLRRGGGPGIVGMSRPNNSTPSLGRYGSLSRPSRANVESPVLGWQTPTGRGQGGGGGSVLPRGGTLADRRPQVPVLPPVAPGERFDHRRWRGTTYAESYEGERERERGRQRSRGGDKSPLSASSTGTSILFDLDEFDRRL
ncbi:hypothetical protein F5Y12DRAFT_185328 [Xylaria sp. FL1777]|nr:hypothetical protein F5Y12DRAFT_185328 [Xylaria sp. FL1777]